MYINATVVTPQNASNTNSVKMKRVGKNFRHLSLILFAFIENVTRLSVVENFFGSLVRVTYGLMRCSLQVNIVCAQGNDTAV